MRNPIWRPTEPGEAWIGLDPEGSAADAGALIDRLLVGHSASMLDLKRRILRVAQSHATVLITGETGSGKECVAQLMHKLSPRRHKPMVSLNCAAIPETLLEGELFGHERGSFTGAQSSYAGKLKLADEGTLFLDEIGDMSLSAQAKILRALETREVFRIGATRSVTFDVRIVSATNQPLERLVGEDRFRRDLFYRLNVAQLHMPALREHPEDVPLLVARYVALFNEAFHRTVKGVDEPAMERLSAYAWPGNVRELRNALEVAFINAESDVITDADLPANILGLEAQKLPRRPKPYAERQLLLDTLQRLKWNKTLVARELHWSRMTLYRKLEKYHIEPD
jgi:DNA-binding NtrC family response regulator